MSIKKLYDSAGVRPILRCLPVVFCSSIELEVRCFGDARKLGLWLMVLVTHFWPLDHFLQINRVCKFKAYRNIVS